jgi:hypothetical protein
MARVSQPPYGNQYGTPVDPYQNQPGYEQGWGGQQGYTDPASGYPYYGNQQGYTQQQPQQPQQQYYQQPTQYQPSQYQQPQPGYGSPGYPGYQTPPPPRRGNGGIIAIVVVLVLVLVGGGIGAAYWLTRSKGQPSASGGGGSGSSAGPSHSPSASPTPAVHTGDLRSFLVDPPGGSRNWPKPLGTDKNLSLDQASELSSDPKARKDMLQQYNFKKGAVQCWIASGGSSVVDVRLYQFDTADHAQSFFQDNIDATGSGYQAENTHPVSGIPGAKSFADPKKDAQGYVSVISIGLKGDVVFVVSIGEKGDKIDLTLPDQLMQKQLAKL